MLKDSLFQQKLCEMLYQSTGIKLHCRMVLASIKILITMCLELLYGLKSVLLYSGDGNIQFHKNY